MRMNGTRPIPWTTATLLAGKRMRPIQLSLK